MRIIGGVHKGLRLQAPPGDIARPTSDRAREAIFNVLIHSAFGRKIMGARVLDLFAGTGALGLEALSRGAQWVLFVEESPLARAAIRRNVEATGLQGRTRVWRRDATALGPPTPGAGAPFDLVFADPPYGKGLGPPALVGARGAGWIADDAVVVLESAMREAAPEPAGFETLATRGYGEARVSFLCPVSR